MRAIYLLSAQIAFLRILRLSNAFLGILKFKEPETYGGENREVKTYSTGNEVYASDVTSVQFPRCRACAVIKKIFDKDDGPRHRYPLPARGGYRC